MATCLSTKLISWQVCPFIFQTFSYKPVGALFPGTYSGESVVIPFEFRWSAVIKRCHYREGDADTQGGWEFILVQLFSALLQMILHRL